MTLPEAPDNERLTALDEAIRTALQVRPPPRLLFGNSSESEGIVSMCIYIYIYIHIDRERERERETNIYIYIYIYIYICTYTQRESRSATEPNQPLPELVCDVLSLRLVGIDTTIVIMLIIVTTMCITVIVIVIMVIANLVNAIMVS